MITRRGFLQSMLAAAAAPYVMSSGIASGILMPVRALVVPEAELYVTLLSAGGELLSKIILPRSARGPSKSDPLGFFEHIGPGRGSVLRTGVFRTARLHHPELGVVPIDLNLSSNALSAGAIMNLMPMRILVA